MLRRRFLQLTYASNVSFEIITNLYSYLNNYSLLRLFSEKVIIVKQRKKCLRLNHEMSMIQSFYRSI